MKCRIVLLTCTFLSALAMPALAQVSSTGSGTGRNFSGTATFGPPHLVMPAITGAAYSGEEVSERVQTLADGTHISQQNTIRKVFRDSQGRTRTERPMFMGPAPESVPVIVEITDPVSGYQYILDAQNKVAHRMALPTPPEVGATAQTFYRVAPNGAGGSVGVSRTGVFEGVIGSVPSMAPPPPPPPPPSGAVPTAVMTSTTTGSMEMVRLPGLPTVTPDGKVRPRFSRETLGTKIIDGVLVEGMRNVTTFPAGMMGNDGDFSVTSESWMSPDLKLAVLTKNNDPRSGENTFRIANLNRGNPDAVLFQVPADYAIVDEKGTFSISYKSQ